MWIPRKSLAVYDEEADDVILCYANQTKYPHKKIRVKQLIIQDVAKHVIKAL